MRIGSGSFFSSRQTGWAAGMAVAAMLCGSAMASAQNAGAAPTPATVDQSTAAASGQVAPPVSASGQTTGVRTGTSTPADATLSVDQTTGQAPATGSPAPATNGAITNGKPAKKQKVAKEDKVVETKATKAAVKQENKYNPLINQDAQLPDKQLYDKALLQAKTGHYDVARLDLQTLLNAYPDSQYQMRAKLEVANCWYLEGGTAALTQAEQEYTDFITFFPNAPEASEAQMRVGDIYFKQMDVPDRDYTKALKAEEAYRTMLKQYPDAPATLLTEDKQKLREVQEVMATGEALKGAFYASHENWAASIARYQTVVNTYPQYSHMDDALIGVGDGYAAQAHAIRAQQVCVAGLPAGTQCVPEAAKARMLENYDGKAAAAYREVVLNHSAAPHVEDAKERLAAMNLPIPVPTKEQQAASDALEGSRAQYTMAKRLQLLFLRTPDTVTAATAGDPPLDDPAATTAPDLLHQMMADYAAAYDPKGAAAAAAAAKSKAAADAAAANQNSTQVPVAPAVNAPLAFQDVPVAGAVAEPNNTMQEAPASGPGGTGVGAEIITPTGSTVPPSTLPAATGAQDPNNGLSAVGPKNSDPLPAAEQTATAPDQLNELDGQKQPAVTPGEKPVNDKNDASDSAHKPKKGIDKLNPF